MNNLIIFDSDFVITNVNILSDYLKNYKDYECYISEVSLSEVSTFNVTNKLNTISNFKSRIKNYSVLGVSFINDNDTMKDIIDKESKKYIKSIFNDNIIRNHSRTSNLLLKRAYDKIPPFGKSDSGFKDTIILLDIIDFLKGKQVKRSYFVTNDDDFIRNKTEIEGEVNNKTDCDFSIIDGRNVEKLLNYFQLGNNKKINELDKEIDDKSELDISKVREDLKNICYNLFHYDGFNRFGECACNNFYVSKKLEKKHVEGFLNNLSNNIQKKIFNSKVFISDFFEDPFLFSNEEKIDMSIFEKLNTIYLQIQKNNGYKEALVNLLLSNFVELMSKPTDDLPF